MPHALARHQPRDRLVEICDDLPARIAEAEHGGWLGEVEGLQISLSGVEDKLAQVDRLSAYDPTCRFWCDLTCRWPGGSLVIVALEPAA